MAEILTKLDFTMDPNLLVSVMKMQAGTLSKALLEGVMNSIDAGASRVDINLDTEKFVIQDDGRGFTSEEEIKEYFGRFGTPHVEGDATFGRFRMGRGQMFAFATTVWSSGRFQMTVDIESEGLTYKLKELDEPVPGCRIEGRLYQPLKEWKLAETLQDLKKLTTYAPKPVYVNGELYGKPASQFKHWTHEDEDAYYRIVPGDDSLKIYNFGVFVESKSAWAMGAGGIVVSKRTLKVNFARNSVLEEQCPVWRRIRERLENLVLYKLSLAKTLSDTERKFLATRLSHLKQPMGDRWRELKLLTGPDGKHLPLSALKSFKRFVRVSESTPFASAIHGSDGTFVVTNRLLNRFGVSTISDWLAQMEHHGLIAQGYQVVEEEALSGLDLGNAKTIDTGRLSRKESAVFETLVILNQKLADKLISWNVIGAVREMRVGVHKTGKTVAWTDGRSYITANRRYFNWFRDGINGICEWLFTLLHEYMHDTDDSESHDHGEVFYQKYHDATMHTGREFATLAREGLKIYLAQLKDRGVPRPRRLMRQLKQ